ncbi:MAG: endopeptidase La [Oscillospiraceae bacterium]|nr:endopeptidase La [Oscillospiraceae bacterium]
MKANINSKTLIKDIPLIPLKNMVLFPGTINHFDIGREQTFRTVENALSQGASVFLIAQRDPKVNEPTLDDLYRFGIVGEIIQILKFSDSMAKVLVRCRYRAKLLSLYTTDDRMTADIRRVGNRKVREDDIDTAKALVRSIRDQLGSYFEYFPRLSSDVVQSIFSEEDFRTFGELIAFNLPLEFAAKQSILEQNSDLTRLRMLLDILHKENNILGIEQKINENLFNQINRTQRDYYLREQMRVISNELGEGENSAEEAEEFKRKIEALPIEDDYKLKLKKDVDRMEMIPASSPEVALLKAYLDTVVSLPWENFTEDNYNLELAQQILDRDHYGITDVKDRMLEFLAVRSLTDEINAQIICLLGPPGVGKTSIAKSVAESMGRKFVRMSLGGIRDEAEIRGHRRTYVGAMPGRIISAMQQAATTNPLILLDEVDKLGNDFRGDPASALLEVLDPEQNNRFRDHYIDIPFDLSKVLFITTANTTDTIPPALLDRMEVVNLSSYTSEDKFNIAKFHLISKQLIKHGLNKKQFSINNLALKYVIDNYTREAGVRNLERQLAKLIRKSVKLIVSKEVTSVKIDKQKVEEMLGPPNRLSLVSSRQSVVGVANGLAWTPVGGEVMPIEVSVIPGSGNINLTGRLGEVMKESAQIAVTYIRSLPTRYRIPDKILSDFDIHVHALEGAVSKDGPSAGVTLTTALVSAFVGTPVKKGLAMTGEITLKGNVLRIGGLKEKMIAAYKEKIKEIIIPKDNMVDLFDIPQNVKSSMVIHPVSSIEQVLDIAIPKINEKQKQ